jgi:hypothetical protein
VNRSFLIIFIPALLVAAMYLAMGMRIPTRVEIGLAVFVAAVAAYRLKVMLDIRKARSASPSAKS